MSTSELKLVACPNRQCNGMVLPTDKICAECHHKLMQCPTCGTVMSETVGI